MVETLTPDLCVIGAGSGGLSVAAAAAQFGVEVVLIEKEKMGGDCLYWGCVPSKALLAAAKKAHQITEAKAFGITAGEAQIDFEAVMAHVNEVIRTIEPNDSIERFTGLGVRVIQAAARFQDKDTVLASGYQIRARRFVIATGSNAALPPIPGLGGVPYLTNKTLFSLKERPSHLIIVGGGPIGIEMAQAFRRLGSQVTVVEAFSPLAKDDPDLVSTLLDLIDKEGVRILAETRIEKVENAEGGISVEVSTKDGHECLHGSHLLIAAGRKPTVDGLDLDKAQIDYDRRGIKVSSGLVTSNKRVFAIGDVIGGAQFTHMANYHAGIVIRRALFRLPAKANTNAIPWVTFTDPELAHVGLNEAEARHQHGKIRVLKWPYAENDRAIAERKTSGEIKVITDRKGRILGASILGENAGELIQMWTLAISRGLKIRSMTEFISPYPTMSEISKRVAYGYFTGSLTNPVMRRIIGWLSKFG